MAVQPAPSRRSLIRAGIAGLAGLTLGALGRPSRASAAAGGSLVMGASNDAGTSNTTLSTASTGTALLVNQNSTGTALRGVAGNGIAGFFTSANGSGVSGVVAAKDRYGVYGGNDSSATGIGAAIRANGKQNHGLVATTATADAYAVKAQNANPGTGMNAGTALVALTAGGSESDVPVTEYAAAGEFVGANGINAVSLASSAGGTAVAAYSKSSDGRAVMAIQQGVAGYTYGVVATVASPDGAGVDAFSTAMTGPTVGVRGACMSTDTAAAGVVGVAYSAGASAVMGLAQSSTGTRTAVLGSVAGLSGEGYGVWGQSAAAGGYAVYSQGRAYVHGTLDVTGALSKGGGSFKIDHPLDPANKYLYHSFVESPDMKNVYDGVVTLDEAGEATIELPAWFEALNRDFRYQLTAMDRGASALHVRSRVRDGHFAIGGGEPGQEICWQVTGTRKDAWAEAHRIPVEQPKPEGERGLYLHPVELGRPKAKGVAEAREAAVRPAIAPAAARPALEKRR